MNEHTIPIACDMTTAPDTPEERLAEYRRLFADSLVGRERTSTGIRFRFRAAPGVGEHIRDLAAREKACCAFYDFTVTEQGDEVIWDASVVDDPVARHVLDEFFALPDSMPDRIEELADRFAARGISVVVDDDGVVWAGSGAPSGSATAG